MNATGISILDDAGNLKLVLANDDILKYYQWLIERETRYTIQRPRHGAHVNILVRRWCVFNAAHIQHHLNIEVPFEYDPENIRQGGSAARGFVNFYIPVKCEFGDNLLKELHINYSNFLGFHFTIGSTKGVKK